MTIFNVGQAKNELSKLLARVEAGEEVEIARDGVPVVKLVRVEQETTGEKFLRMWENQHPGEFTFDEEKFEFTEDELDDLFYHDDQAA